MNNKKHNTTNPFSFPEGRNNPFVVPEGYFDSLPDNIMKRIKKQSPDKSGLIHFSKHYVRYAAAAVILVAMTLTGILIFRDKPSTDTIVLENITIEYFLNNGFDEAIITEYIVDNTSPVLAQDIIMAETLSNSVIESELPANETDEELIKEYLMENGITESELLNL